jgi:hypothetical protein
MKHLASIFTKRGGWRAALILLMLLGGLLRLIDTNDPPLDFHSTRQMRNNLVARSILYDHDQNADPNRRMLAATFRRSVGTYEPPVVETLVGLTYLMTGENFAVARVYQTLFWLSAGFCLFDLARRMTGWIGAFVALAYYLILPFSVQASRSFQPDPLMSAAFVAGIYFLYRWSEEQDPAIPKTAGSRRSWRWAILAGVLLGLAAFVKIVIAFLIGGAVLGLVLSTLGRRSWKNPQVWLMFALMITPAFYYYVVRDPGRSSEYFFAWTVGLINLIVSLEFYSKWLAMLGSLFGLTLLFLSVVGLLLSSPRARWLLMGIWLGYILYGLTLPFQMYTHSYYHIQMIPIVALGLAPIASLISGQAALQTLPVRLVLSLLVVGVTGYYSWVDRSILIAEDFGHEPGFWLEVGNAIPPDANVIGLTQDYGYRLMYWGWQKVSLWPISTDLVEARGGNLNAGGDFDELTVGKDYFLVTAFGQLEKQPRLKERLDSLPIAAQGEGYILYTLLP